MALWDLQARAFGLPLYKYCIDGYRFTKEYVAMWRAAEKQKMDTIKKRNTVRKAGGLFKRGLLPKGSRRRLGGAVAPADGGEAAADAAAAAAAAAGAHPCSPSFVPQQNR